MTDGDMPDAPRDPAAPQPSRPGPSDPMPGGRPLPGTESEWPGGFPAGRPGAGQGPAPRPFDFGSDTSGARQDAAGPGQDADPGASAEEPPPVRKRGFDGTTIATLLLESPWYLWSLALIYVLAGTFVAAPWHWLVVGIWVLAGAAMLWKPAEVMVARFLLRLRQPSMTEAAKLDAALRAVTRQAGTSSEKYVVLIEEAPEVSALAYGGHTIAVTRWAISVLPQRHLEAVLAHELAHHISGHTWPSALGLWYTLPARGAVWVVKSAVRASRAVPVLGCLLSGFLVASMLGMLLSAVILGYFSLPLLFFVFVLLAPVFLAAVDRLAEKNADKVAARMGFGKTLLEVLNGWQAQGQDTAHYQAPRRTAVMSRHPSIADRIRALEKHVYANPKR